MIPIIKNNNCTGYEIYYDNNYFICSSLYEYNKDDIHNKSIHITNPNLQNEEIADNELIFLNKDKLNDVLVVEMLDKKILDLCKIIFMKENLPNILNPYQETNCYELFGLDLILDDTGKLWLLEINISPGLDIMTSSVKKSIIPQLMEDMFTLIFTKIKKMNIKTKVKNLKLIGTNYYLR